MHPYFCEKYFPFGHCVILLSVESGWRWCWLWGDEQGGDWGSDFNIYPTQDAAFAASNALADEFLAERLEDDAEHGKL